MLDETRNKLIEHKIVLDEPENVRWKFARNQIFIQNDFFFI